LTANSTQIEQKKGTTQRGFWSSLVASLEILLVCSAIPLVPVAVDWVYKVRIPSVPLWSPFHRAEPVPTSVDPGLPWWKQPRHRQALQDIWRPSTQQEQRAGR
jgi:hypothetical protein